MMLQAFYEGMAAYAGLVVECTTRMSVQDARFEKVEAEVLGQKGSIFHITGRVTALETAANDIASASKANPSQFGPHPPHNPIVLPLPPMRPEMDSAHQMVESGTQKLELGLRKLASQSPGDPNSVVASPEKLALMFRHVFAEETAQLEAARAQRLRDAELAKYRADEAEAHAEEARRKKKAKEDAEEEAKEDRRRRRNMWASIAAAVIGAALIGGGGLLWGIARHEAGLAEGKANAPVVVTTVPVPIPVPMGTLAPPNAPATATGAVAPAPPHH
jgi:hypothetical protein